MGAFQEDGRGAQRQRGVHQPSSGCSENSGKDQGLCLVIGGVCVLRHLSRVQLSATPWTVSNQAPLSMGFSRQESWSGLLCLPLGDPPDPGTEPASLTSPALAGGFSTASATWEAPIIGGGKANS